MNENYPQPSLPPGVEADVVRGMYRFAHHDVPASKGTVRLLGSGAILREVIAAGEMLAAEWNVASEVWSITSFCELAREARETDRFNRLHPAAQPQRSHLERCLPGDTPIVAATDYVRAYPQLIASYVDARFVALGTDGFGRSDTRPALRRFFEVDRQHIVVAALEAVAAAGGGSRGDVAAAIAAYGLAAEAASPWRA
jgi:pyruvate dehydrogenase E1 component